ncbi:MAG TPA: histidinol phosphatase [Blastocatellia bacterium]|nr:histidinol phosphatase [Blastocatellia bacterium]
MRKTILPTLLSVVLCLLITALCLSLSLPQFQKPALSEGRKYSFVERIQPEHLRAVHEDRAKYAQMRRPVTLRTGYKDYRAILHAHAEDSAHTGGTRTELLAAAKRTGVSIVMLTDHVRPPRDFITDSWRGPHEGVLFIPGAEAEGFLAYPLSSIKGTSWKTRDDYISLIRKGGGDIFLSHVEERPDWPTARLDGMEIYNHHTDFKDEQGEFVKWIRATVSDPDRLAAFERLLAEYPQEIFSAQQDYLVAFMAKWDRDSQTHRVTGVAANDCHHNQVITVKVGSPDAIELWLTGDKNPSLKITADRASRLTELTAGRQAGDIIARLDFDPYERSLSYVSTHILAKGLSEAATRGALKQAHVYVAHDWLCDPTGFAFVAESVKPSRRIGVMGDEIRFTGRLRLRVAAPAAGVIRLFRNGENVREVEDDTLEWEVTSPGTYRAEVWLKLDGEMRPWIYANQIRCLAAP